MSTVSPSQIPALVSDLGIEPMLEGYQAVDPVYQDIFAVQEISASSPPEGFAEAVITGGKVPKLVRRGADADAVSMDQVFTYQARVDKFSQLIEIPEEIYNDPNANNIIRQRYLDAIGAWGSGWAQRKETESAALFNRGPIAAGDVNVFDGSYPGRAATYPKFIYDGKPFFAASGNGHPLGLQASTTKYNLVVSAALSSTTLEAARILMEDTNAYDETGDRVTIRPSVLVVPPGLEQTAAVLLESTLKPDTANNAINTHRGILRPITWRYLTDADSWFLGTAGQGVQVYDSGPALRIDVAPPAPRSGNVTIRGTGYFGRGVKNWRYWVAQNIASS